MIEVNMFICAEWDVCGHAFCKKKNTFYIYTYLYYNSKQTQCMNQSLLNHFIISVKLNPSYLKVGCCNSECGLEVIVINNLSEV